MRSLLLSLCAHFTRALPTALHAASHPRHRPLSPPQFFPYELTGIPSLAAWNSTHAEEQPPWQSPVWARNSGTSFTNTIPIPFVTSLKITLTFTGAAGKSAVLYYQAHGRLLSLIDGFSFGGVELPISARLVVQRNDLVLPRLAYLPIVNVSAGSAALIAAMAIAFSAPNLNTLEGCFHSYVTAATSYPGELHSTGTEDEFLSSYYFDMGPFQGRGAGVYYKRSSPAALSMWRSYYDDPMILNDGGAFVWRNGDTSDPVTGIKCSIQTGGSPAGDPQDANVQTMAFVYVVANT